MKKEIYKCPVYLWINYSLLGKSSVQIGIECGVSDKTIINWLRKFNFKIKAKGFQKKHIPWNKNLSKETNKIVKRTGEKISKKLKGMKRSIGSRRKQGKSISGKKHHQWKDNIAGYHAKHDYIKKIIDKTEICFLCGQKYDKNGSSKLSIMNLDHKYNRNDLNSWKYAHYSCHKTYDLNKKEV